ncbi:MAG TPA: molybdopterin-dependent oxidoreductase [Thermomicrobiales bacterium]|nr:molybdopterin-dependent oxidoreductase [Thermomicrobiales bacterium]
MSAAETQRRDRRALALAGSTSGLATVTFMLATRNARGTDAPIELLGNAMLQAMPLGIFTFMLETFQHAAKPMLLASLSVGVVLAGGILGTLSRGALARRTWRRMLLRVFGYTTGIWAPLAILLVVIASFGTTVPLDTPRLTTLALWLAADALAYSVALHFCAPVLGAMLAPRSTQVDVDAPAVDQSRRRLLAASVGGLIVATGLGLSGAFIRDVYRGGAGGKRGVIPEPITPVGQFYIISKNFSDPRVDVDDWELQLSGLLDKPRVLTHDDLLGYPQVTQLTTLTCISNQIGGDLIGNAEWTGVRLADLLLGAGLQSGTVKLALYAHDGYTESMPLSKALESTTLLVHAMNGEPLTARHGRPARLIVPGKYGIKNVKWVRRIDAVAGDFRGFWQQRGWTDDATIQTMSRIDVPRSREIIGLDAIEIGGVAFAGDRGISRVEWSADGGVTWREADVIEQVAALSWVIWRSTWNPTRRGSHRLVVRATDGRGETQPEERQSPIPDGATGLHGIDVGVA